MNTAIRRCVTHQVLAYSGPEELCKFLNLVMQNGPELCRDFETPPARILDP